MASFTRLLRLLGLATAAGANPDAALLDRFVLTRDEDAFADLVRRHGPLVRRVCRRSLPDPGAADDAFQATFLVLARRAGSLRRPELLAGWLHGVACRVARKASRATARAPRQWPADAPDPADPRPDPLADLSARELVAAIDEEVARLPEVSRLPVILCCLEGLTLDEAAARLGCSRDAVKGRLERGRAKLHARLERRGLSLGAALVAVELSLRAGAPVSAESAQFTARAARRFAARQTTDIPDNVVALTREVLHPMSSTRIKLALVCLLALCGTLAAGLLSPPQAPRAENQTVATGEPQAPAETKPKAEDKARELPVAGEGIGQLTVLSFDSDGKAFTTAGVKSSGAEGGGIVVRWDAATGARLAAARKLPEGYAPTAVSPDGKWALGVKGLGEGVSLVELASGKEVKLGEHAMTSVRGFSPDGKAVLMCSAAASSKTVSSELKVWDVATGKLRFEKDGSGTTSEKAYYSAEFSPDGKHMIVTRGDRTRALELLDAESGKEVANFAGPAGGLRLATVSPDGTSVAAWGWESKEVTLFDVAKREGTTLKGHTNYVRAATFTPDGKSLVTAALDGTALIWDLTTGKVQMTLTLAQVRKPVDVRSLAVDPKGRVLVAVSRRGAQVWDLASGKELAPLPDATRVLFSPDGKTMAVLVGGTHGPGGFGPRGGNQEETADKVTLIPVADLLKGQEKKPSNP